MIIYTFSTDTHFLQIVNLTGNKFNIYNVYIYIVLRAIVVILLLSYHVRACPEFTEVSGTPGLFSLCDLVFVLND